MTKRPIGFDRQINLEWLDAVAAQVAAGATPAQVRQFIHHLLDGVLANGKSGSALTKTTTVLAHIWSQVPPAARALRDRTTRLLPHLPPEERLALHWAMATATYPFFADVAEAIGRLSNLQGDVSQASLIRRLAEKWGDRSLMPQAARKVIRSMVQWGVLKDTDQPGVYHPASKIRIQASASLLLVESLLADESKTTIPIAGLARFPGLFPFEVEIAVQRLRRADQFQVHRQGFAVEVVELVRG